MDILETPRLRLRVLDKVDAPWILELVSGEDWIRNIGDRGVRTLEDAEAYIERMRERQETHEFSFYGVFSSATGEGVAVLDFARTKLGLTEVLGLTSPQNLGSIATLKKMGLALDPNFIGDPAFEPAVYFRKKF